MVRRAVASGSDAFRDDRFGLRSWSRVDGRWTPPFGTKPDQAPRIDATPAVHTLPTVFSRARVWISAWLITGVSRRKRSMMERT